MFGVNKDPAEKLLPFYKRSGFKNFFKFGFPMTMIVGATLGAMVVNYRRNQKNMTGQFYYHQSLVHSKMEVGAQKYRCTYQYNDDSQVNQI